MNAARIACTARAGSCDLSKGLVSDDRAGTLTIHLTDRDPDLPYKLALPQGFPVPPGTPRTEVPRGPPATGPYRVARAKTTKEVVLVRNPRFREWSSAAQPAWADPDRIRMRLGLQPEAQVAAIRNGQADLTADTYNFDDAYWRRLMVASGSRVRVSPASIDKLRVPEHARSALRRRARPPRGQLRCRPVIPGRRRRRPQDVPAAAADPIGNTARYCPWGDGWPLRAPGGSSRGRALAARASACGHHGRASQLRSCAQWKKRCNQLGFRTSVRVFSKASSYFETVNRRGSPGRLVAMDRRLPNTVDVLRAR